MKFTNYGIPSGLGIFDYNSKIHNSAKFNGITHKNMYGDSIKNKQIGGSLNNLNSCETVFYIIDHKLPTVYENNQNEMSEEEEVVDIPEMIEDEVAEMPEMIEDKVAEMSEDDKLLEELHDLNENKNEKSKESRVLKSNPKNKIRTLDGLFSDTTSHDSLRSILQALKQSTRSSK